MGLEVISSEFVLFFDGCRFYDNDAISSTPNIYLNRALKVEINSCVFINSVVSSGTSVAGNFIQVIAESNVTVSNSSFINGYAFMGGAIYMLGNSWLTVINSSFSYNSASNSGGAIYANCFSSINITGGTTFKSNSAVLRGDAIYAQIASDGVSIDMASFTHS
jgi:predicted outer membrane repeat protein